MKHDQLPLRVQAALVWARVSLVWERLLRVLFPAALFAFGYAGLALMGLFEALGDPLRLICLFIAIAGFAGFVWRNHSSWRLPGLHEVLRRAENDGHVPAGLLFDLLDRPAQSDAKAGALWRGHMERGREKSRNLHMQAPHAVWITRDRLGAWALVTLLVFTGLVWAGSGAVSRMQIAISPHWLATGAKDVQVEAWLNAPEYSRLPPRFLGKSQNGSLRALPGSQILVRVNGAHRTPVLQLPGARKPVRLTRLGTGIYEGKARLQTPGTIRLRGGARARWEFVAKADQKPQIAFTRPPDVSAQGELELPVQASDDFGVTKINLLMDTDAPGHFAKSDVINAPFSSGRTVVQTISLDLTQHVMAGLPVILRLQAQDGAGQMYVSAPVSITLPEKLFINPWAAAFAEQRLLLMRDGRKYVTDRKNQGRDKNTIWMSGAMMNTESTFARLREAPAGIARAARLQRALMRAPEQGVEDPLIWLGLSYVNARLLAARSQSDLHGLPADMWQMALRAEGGEVESAAAAMRLAEHALQTALLLGAPPADLKRLSDRYEKAVQRYLQALAEQALKDGQKQGGGNAMANLSGDQLQEMLDALKQLNATGARDDARRLLKALSQLLTNMRLQLANGGQGGNGDDPVSQAMRKALEELGDLMGKQRELMDQAQRAQNQQQNKKQGKTQTGKNQPGGGQQGQQKVPGNGQMQAQQQGLGSKLRDLQSGGAIAGAQTQGDLNEAGKAMDRAAQAFGEDDRAKALEEGGKAMGELREGAQKLAGELMQRREQAQGKRDPFGRSADGGMASGEGPAVPDKINPERARKILQELRNRAADQSRPREEREYLQRLLERF